MKIECSGWEILSKFNKNMALINGLAVSNIPIRTLYKYKNRY